MKKSILLGVFLTLLASSISFAQESNCKLKVIYFHATNRCPTCLAIEENAKSVLSESFKTQIDNGEIIFEAINIDEEANRAICKKHKVYGSTLLLIETGGNKEKVTDFSDQAFSFAKNDPDKYKALLKEEISSKLK